MNPDDPIFLPQNNGRPSLRKWKAVHIEEHIPHLTGRHEDELFYRCAIDNLRGAVLINCCMTECKYNIQEIEDMQNVVMGLDCQHFSNVELSEKAFDYMALLLVRTRGNTEKRLKIIEALGGKERVRDLLNARYPGNEV